MLLHGSALAVEGVLHSFAIEALSANAGGALLGRGEAALEGLAESWGASGALKGAEAKHGDMR